MKCKNKTKQNKTKQNKIDKQKFQKYYDFDIGKNQVMVLSIPLSIVGSTYCEPWSVSLQTLEFVPSFCLIAFKWSNYNRGVNT
jgi:hypothetical protein